MNKVSETIQRELFIIETLKTEDSSCKGCKQEAIQYHKDLVFMLKALNDLCYFVKGNFALDVYLGEGEELSFIKEMGESIDKQLL